MLINIKSVYIFCIKDICIIPWLFSFVLCMFFVLKSSMEIINLSQLHFLYSQTSMAQTSNGLMKTVLVIGMFKLLKSNNVKPSMKETTKRVWVIHAWCSRYCCFSHKVWLYMSFVVIAHSNPWSWGLIFLWMKMWENNHTLKCIVI